MPSNNINLFNFNQFNAEDPINGCMGSEDVSSIFPSEVNEWNFQENQNGYIQPIKRDESVGALTDLLESLNKSNENQNMIDEMR